MTRNAAQTLVEILQGRAAEQPQRVGYIFLEDGERAEQPLTYAELDCAARGIAAALAAHGGVGERAVLLYPPGLDYVRAYMGCLYAGWTPVPAYPPEPSRLRTTFPRLRSIIQESKPAALLTTSAIRGIAGPLLGQIDVSPLPQIVATDGVSSTDAHGFVPARIDGQTVALLQYTSGSVSRPKGVIITHANLLHNLALIAQTGQTTAASSGVSWLPPYHDMGLIGGILNPLYSGYPMTLMSPLHFLMRPLRWLQALTRIGATISVAPNFSFALTVRKVREEDKKQLDLSALRTVYNGAEPIQADVLDAFAAAFHSVGFRKSAFLPCYGLAEATLMVTGIECDESPRYHRVSRRSLKDGVVAEAAAEDDVQVVVGCGRPSGDAQLEIVEPATHHRLEEGRVGEIWLRSGSVGAGYWARPDETEETFGARLAGDSTGHKFMRTGDLGFVHDGQLHVVGRLKDLIIVRGRNHYPPDIEQTVEAASPHLRAGSAVATAAEVDGCEQLLILAEVDPQGLDAGNGSASEKSGAELIVGAIREAVLERHELAAWRVALVMGRSVPKTPSGKVQRSAARTAYLQGEMTVLYERTF